MPLNRFTPLTRKTPLKKTAVKKRKPKTEIKKAKDRLWELCKIITRKVHGYNCYTCGAYTEVPHTGHFITDSICSTELSYDLGNLRTQCFRCNINLSGNWVAYERNLIRDFGEDYVRELKERNERTKGKQYDILWYRNQITKYEQILESL